MRAAEEKERPLILLLASASPRRLQLLSQVGISPEKIVPTSVDESLLKEELPAQAVMRLAELKAETVAEKYSDCLVLAADTLVAAGRRILPKPADRHTAERNLQFLSGRRHRVYGGICLIGPGPRKWKRLVRTHVAFKRLEKSEIRDYIAAGEWEGKAGGYAIQGRAGAFVKRINGSYSNVVGLSLFETVNLLKGAGYSVC